MEIEGKAHAYEASQSELIHIKIINFVKSTTSNAPRQLAFRDLETFY